MQILCRKSWFFSLLTSDWRHCWLRKSQKCDSQKKRRKKKKHTQSQGHSVYLLYLKILLFRTRRWHYLLKSLKNEAVSTLILPLRFPGCDVLILKTKREPRFIDKTRCCILMKSNTFKPLSKSPDFTCVYPQIPKCTALQNTWEIYRDNAENWATKHSVKIRSLSDVI